MPEGKPTCRAVPPQGNDACGKPAQYLALFVGEGGSAHCCAECAMHLQQTAEAHKTALKLEKL